MLIRFKESATGPGGEVSRSARPEIELLLCCARTRLDAGDSERINQLAQRVGDWDYLVRAASTHGVMPLLYRSLNAACPGRVPAETRGRIRDYCRSNTQRNLLLTGELIRLIRLLNSHGIPSLPYKGPVLAAAVYGDISLRTFTDLDLLLHKQDVLKAKNLLISQGFQLRKKMSERGQTAHLESRNQKDFAFISGDGLVKVELHWRIASQALFPLDVEKLWDRLEEVSIGGAKVLNIRAEDMLLILCVHGAKHYFARLEWVCDIAELVRNMPGLDWHRVLEQAGMLGNRRPMFIGLLLARELLGVTLPEKLLSESESDPVAASLASQMREAMFREPGRSDEVFNRGGHRVALRDRFIDRMRVRLYFYALYLRIVVTPTQHDVELFPLPGVLSFLHYLVRPIRLAKTYGPILWILILSRLKIRNTGQSN